MPKIIDNYVLQDKIGSGQFGDVFKGFNQETNLEVAIKTIKRETIKGKFYELLENQIKVLKTCDNPYIMKLYALKKTANHYYLILEYCNGGDMLGKLKAKKRLEENVVIRYLCQILTGFQALVKHKIMHRDFKLANILLHDDNIKIADFGFSKLLNTEDYTSTMLGSPLNMAPEVLGGNKYNNKADIWSIGACIYEMLYGKYFFLIFDRPPYMAANMVDLLKNINTKPLSFPSDVKANPVLVDVIKKMLTPDVKKRISWNDLFAHPVNRHLDTLLRKQIDLELIQDESLMINTSKYYLKKNLVVGGVEEIQEKAKVNGELIEMVKTGQKVKYAPTQQIQEQNRLKTGHQSKPSEITVVSKQTSELKPGSEQKKQEDKNPSLKKSTLNQQKNFSHIYRKNSKLILHFRNIYSFLALVVEELSESTEEGAELASYVIVKKIVKMIEWLRHVLCSQKPMLEQLERWHEYTQQKEYLEVKDYIEKEENVFLVYASNLQSSVKGKVLKGELGKEARDLVMAGVVDDQMYFKHVSNYIKPLVKKITHQTLCTKDFNFCKKQWRHVENVLICLNFESEFNSNNQSMHSSMKQSTIFDFNKFYEEKEASEPEKVLLKVEEILHKIC